ncbi:MAG: transketolase [Bacteroidales bacterium]|nr:transketolase [Candidatus Cryptobacteroides aphodequi]
MENLQKIASQVRRDVIRMVNGAGSGHPGGSIGIADVLTTLYFKEMQHDPKTWTRSGKGQDVFILSAGHLAPVYYSELARSGYFPIEELGTLRKMGSRLQGHPCVTDNLPGVFKPSGSLGQGLAVAAGMALGKKMDGDAHRVYVLCGDGESEEGEIWESAMWAQHHKVDNLIAMTDWNGQQIDGPTTTVTGIEDLRDKWSAFGWDVIVADGHDFDSIESAFELAHAENGKPKMILFKTEMGHGVDFMAGTHKWHGKAPNAEECAAALAQLEETLGDY